MSEPKWQIITREYRMSRSNRKVRDHKASRFLRLNISHW